MMESPNSLWIPEPSIPVKVLGQDFMAWRWQDAPERGFNVFSRLENVQPQHLDGILVLNRRSSEHINNRIRRDVLLVALPEVKSVSVKSYSKLEEQKIRDWLYSLGLPFQSPVIVQDFNIMLTTWKMVVRYFDIWEWANNVSVFDESLQWCVHFDHEDRIRFSAQKASEKIPEH